MNAHFSILFEIKQKDTPVPSDFSAAIFKRRRWSKIRNRWYQVTPDGDVMFHEATGNARQILAAKKLKPACSSCSSRVNLYVNREDSARSARLSRFLWFLVEGEASCPRFLYSIPVPCLPVLFPFTRARYLNAEDAINDRSDIPTQRSKV